MYKMTRHTIGKLEKFPIRWYILSFSPNLSDLQPIFYRTTHRTGHDTVVPLVR